MAESRLERAIGILELVARVVVPLGLQLVEELRRLKELRDSGRELTGEDWAQADEDFEAACAKLEALLGEEEG